MALIVIVANNTRLDDADANTDFGHWGGGGAAPASEPQLRYQYSGVGAVGAINKKTTGTAGSVPAVGIGYDPGAGALDMTAAANKLWLAKVYVADYGDLNAAYGLKLGIGSSSADYYEYNVAGSGANGAPYNEGYPAKGGYLIVALNPNIVGWRENTVGTPVLTTVDWCGVQALFIAGGAKSENLAIDAIDIGTGLTLTRGDAGSTEGVFQDFVDKDEGTIANRWGYAVAVGSLLLFRGMFTIGESGTATEFSDIDAVVSFPDGYHSAGLFGITINLTNANTVIEIGATIIGEGNITTEDTRPDFIVSGTTVTTAMKFTGALKNHRNITFTSKVDVDGANLECQLLTQGSCNIENTLIKTRSLTSIACLQDPIFGTTTDLHDCTFLQGGAGHAIEINAAGSYTLTNINFSGYGATTSDSAAIDVTATSGTVTLNISGGTTPTYKTAGATVNVVSSVSFKFTVSPSITSYEWRLYEVTALGSLAGAVEKDGEESATVDNQTYSYSYTTDKYIAVQIIGHANDYIESITYYTLKNADQEVTVLLVRDDNN